MTCKFKVPDFEKRKMDKSKEVRTLGPRCLDTTSQFPQITLIPQIPKTSITQPSDDLYTCVRPYKMQNWELKTMDYFTCIPAHDFGYFESSIPKLV